MLATRYKCSVHRSRSYKPRRATSEIGRSLEETEDSRSRVAGSSAGQVSKRCVQILQLERGSQESQLWQETRLPQNAAAAIVAVSSTSASSQKTMRASRMTLRGPGALSPSRVKAAPRTSSPHRRPASLQRIRQRHASSGGRRRASDPSRFTRIFVPKSESRTEPNIFYLTLFSFIYSVTLTPNNSFPDSVKENYDFVGPRISFLPYSSWVTKSRKRPANTPFP